MAISRSNDRGFVLIGAIWLLVLAGAVGAALLLRSLAEARTAAAESGALADRIALDGAAESAFASLLFSGPRSTLASGGGTVTIGGQQITLRVSSEATRFDLNEADPLFIDGVLHGLKVSPDERNRIVEALTEARSKNRRMSSQAELRQLLGSSVPLEDAFTLYSGLSKPASGEQPDVLARRLLSPAAEPEPVELRAGTPLRVDASLPRGAHLTVVARLTGLQDDPLAVQRWEHRAVAAAQ